jgi:hypothetical protein
MHFPAASPAAQVLTGLLASMFLAFVLVGCGSSGGSSAPVDPGDPDDTIKNMDPDTAAEMKAAWSSSGHSDFDAEAFRHWDDDGEIPTSCAKCHSTPGFRDFIGADGSAAGSVENPAPLGTTVNCDACHNMAAQELTEVTFPSGAIATDLGAEARCMTCHQGRESTVSLNLHIAGAAPATEDTISTDLSFRNIHYYAAGATLYGGSAKGAYQYTLPGGDGAIGTPDDEIKYGFYDTRNPHVAAADTCIECHDPHSLERRIDLCATCHAGVTSDADLRNIRMAGSVRDYDGDGDTTEGIYHEIKTLESMLLAAIQAYASNVNAAPIMYDAHAYPYWFYDNGSGATYSNSYKSWTARLLRAAYNYQYAQKDPGAYAHNPKYVIEFLYDSIADLHAHPSVTVPNFDALWRNDGGHFDAGAEAFRHWDRPADEIEDGSIDRGTVSSSCVRCHSPEGFDFWAEYGLDLPREAQVGDGFRCEQCHVENADFAGTPQVKYIDKVDFPSGVIISNDPSNVDNGFLCMSCHKGRESGATVDADIAARLAAGRDPRFRNIHYMASGATLYGAAAEVGYQYRTGAGMGSPFKDYAPKWNHFQTLVDPGGNSEGARCTFCHLEDHSFTAQAADTCKGCHGDIPLEEFRLGRLADYDGDPATTTLKSEVEAFADRLWTASVDYENVVLGGTLTMLPGYPYYAATTWDEKLVRALFNYQFWAKEHGAWAHNTHYMMQLLYDSIVDLGGDTTGLVRP